MKVLVAVLLTVLLQGCYLGPVIPYHDPRLDSRGRIPAEAWTFVRPGATTRAEVLLGLGDPDALFCAEDVFVYNWALVRFVFFCALPAHSGVEVPIPIDEFLVVRFDERGLVARCEKIYGMRDFERARAGWDSPMESSRRRPHP